VSTPTPTFGVSGLQAASTRPKRFCRSQLPWLTIVLLAASSYGDNLPARTWRPAASALQRWGPGGASPSKPARAGVRLPPCCLRPAPSPAAATLWYFVSELDWLDQGLQFSGGFRAPRSPAPYRQSGALARHRAPGGRDPIVDMRDSRFNSVNAYMLIN
jgi:hypothetical protein